MGRRFKRCRARGASWNGEKGEREEKGAQPVGLSLAAGAIANVSHTCHNILSHTYTHAKPSNAATLWLPLSLSLTHSSGIPNDANKPHKLKTCVCVRVIFLRDATTLSHTDTHIHAHTQRLVQPCKICRH